MKFKLKYFVPMIFYMCILGANHLMDYYINLGYEHVISAILRTYFIVSASIFLGIWESKHLSFGERSKNNE